MKSDLLALVEMSRWVGSGKVDPQSGSQLRFARRGGEGLLWPVTINGVEQWLWCDESQWYEWASPFISVSDLQELAPPMLAVVSELISNEFTAFVGKNVVWNVPVKGCVTKENRLLFYFHKDGRSLECQLLDWPDESIRQITHDWQAAEVKKLESHDALRCNAALQIGTLSASPAQVLRWEAGDGILISHPAELSCSQLWFRIGNSRFLMKCHPHGEFVMQQQIEDIKDVEINMLSNEEISRINDINFIISVEIGNVSLSLPELLNLQPGDCLSGVMNLDHKVSLIMQGRKIGRGDLLKIDEQWAVRITEIN